MSYANRKRILKLIDDIKSKSLAHEQLLENVKEICDKAEKSFADDLIELLELCLPLDATFETQRDTLKDLTKYAVEFRYPGEMAVREDARAALRAIRSFRDFVRQKLEL